MTFWGLSTHCLLLKEKAFLRKQKEAEGALRFFCLRPHLRDSRCQKAAGCPFGVRVNPHFPKCRPDPILLPESFCVPLRRRGPRGLSRNPSSDRYALVTPDSYTSKPKNAGFRPLISYKLSITPALCKVKRKRPKEGEDSLSLAMLDSSLREGASDCRQSQFPVIPNR